MKLRAIVGVCLAGAAALPSPRNGERCVGTWMAENCRATCGLVCSACADDTTWSYGTKASNTCAYVAQKLKRCKSKNTDGIRSAREACPATCGTCSAPTLRGSYSV